MEKVARFMLILLIMLMFSTLFSCDWFSNPDDNPNRPDEPEGTRWGDSFWGAGRWN